MTDNIHNLEPDSTDLTNSTDLTADSKYSEDTKNIKIKDKLPSVTVYCGASKGNKDIYLTAAKQMGICLAKEGIHLVYGGGDKGMMGMVSSALIENGGSCTGVIPDFMLNLEWANRDIQDLRIVKSMSERKEMLMNLAAGLIVLPGGIGTMEEFFDALSWSQLLLHHKPIGILNVAGYYDPLLSLIDNLIKEGFVDENSAKLFVVASEPHELLLKMAKWEHHNKQKEVL